MVEHPSEASYAALEEGRNLARETPRLDPGAARPGHPDAAWRGELAQRLQAYRARRRRVVRHEAQSQFSFETLSSEPPAGASVIVEEAAPPHQSEDFSFTIAIGRNAAARDDSRMVIDVSSLPETQQPIAFSPAPEMPAEPACPFPVASIDERRIAGLIDGGCLLFAYGAFLTLFGSLGGQFTFNKLSVAVCLVTFVFVYLQYFGLFTIFGGTTPGMMLRGLHVVSLSGEMPTPRQMLWRSIGYMLSAGSFFMGFVWALWDEDGLTWHDRLSHTCLCPAPTFADIEATHSASGH
ncbi:MAG TPA: RDD family protein [Candidatus Acidoferrum sp.]|nr:RDD family protein [Candidatus Acidoferrum sp.]